MNDVYDYLVKTLIQRGESDNYILQRLRGAGVQDDEAFHLIQKMRQSNEAVHAHFEIEWLFILLAVLIPLALIAWLVLIQI
jgi:hypothetical protein